MVYCTDITARDFWRSGGNPPFSTFEYTHPKSPSTKYVQFWNEKDVYNQRNMNIEHGTFTPLVFTINWGIWAKNVRCVTSSLASEKISEKGDEKYE